MEWTRISVMPLFSHFIACQLAMRAERDYSTISIRPSVRLSVTDCLSNNGRLFCLWTNGYRPIVTLFDGLVRACGTREVIRRISVNTLVLIHLERPHLAG